MWRAACLEPWHSTAQRLPKSLELRTAPCCGMLALEPGRGPKDVGHMLRLKLHALWPAPGFFKQSACKNRLVPAAKPCGKRPQKWWSRAEKHASSTCMIIYWYIIFQHDLMCFFFQIAFIYTLIQCSNPKTWWSGTLGRSRFWFAKLESLFLFSWLERSSS